MKPFAAILLCSFAAWAQSDIRGFSPEQAKLQRELEIKARAVPEPARLRAYMEKMAAEPHIAGSPASKAVADYAAGLMREWGLQVAIEQFDALLPYPTRRILEMTAPTRYTAKLREPVIAEDRDSGDRNQVPTYNSYAATADVTAPLLYVNYGVPEDYQKLKKLGIDPKGKIVIARYGKSWRGTKPKVAQENGAVGCLIYSDPRDDGYFQGDTYPKGPYRPPAGVQRGSVMDMPLYVGDPLTPGWASEKGARRLDRKEAGSLMKIPVLPISYEDAQPLLAALTGPVAPEPWRGALPITYHVGPGPSTVHLATDFDWTVKPLYDVVATIPGADGNDQWVMYGNHHDAWVNGAQDPVSGAIAVLETARTLAGLQKSGWRPKRTIKLALWDAEEFGLIGSTEWAEKHETELKNSVLYLNSDTNGTGRLSAGGSPALEAFFTEVIRDVQDPVSGDSVLKKARARKAQGEPAKDEDDFRLSALGAGSDYVAFFHHSGVPSINAGFSGDDPGGIYHSIYDSLDWYLKFSDKNFVFGKALAQIMTTALLRMADAPLLPFEFGAVSGTVKSYVDDLSKNKKLDLREVSAEVDNLKAAAAKFEAAYSAAAAGGKGSAEINASILAVEHTLLQPAGLPGRPWYKNQIAAPGVYTGYSAKTLPGIREAAEAGRYEEANAQAKVVAATLRAYVAQIGKATAMLAGL